MWYGRSPIARAERHTTLKIRATSVFLPRFLKSRRHARKFETILAPLFPRYLFIVLDLTIAAAGRPAIFIGSRSGEVAQLLNEQGWGFCVEPPNGAELAQRILQLAREPHLRKVMAERARAASLNTLNRASALAHWETLLGSLDSARANGY